MNGIKSLKFIQDNYKKLSLEDIAKELEVRPLALKRKYPTYFFKFKTIVYDKLNKFSITEDRKGNLKYSRLKVRAPKTYVITETERFIRWQNPLVKRTRAIEDKFFWFTNRYINVKGSTYIYHDKGGDQYFFDSNYTKIGKALGLSYHKVSLFRKAGLITKVETKPQTT